MGEIVSERDLAIEQIIVCLVIVVLATLTIVLDKMGWL